MIANELKNRIVADVSGDLPPVESRQLRAELAKLPAARGLHEDLCRDRDRLAALPRVRVGVDLAPAVLDRLAVSGPIIRLPARAISTPSGRRPRWAGFVAAMVVAGVAIWLAVTGDKPTPAPREKERNLARDTTSPSPVEANDPPERPAEVVVAPPPGEQPQAPVAPPTKPPLPKVPGEVLTAAPASRPNAELVERPRFSVPISAADLMKSDGQKRLVAEMQRGSDHRLDIFTKDTHHAWDLLVRGWKAKGVTIIPDPLVPEARKRRLQNGYAIILEGVSPADVGAVTRGMLTSNGKASGVKDVVLTPITDEDRRELKTWLGQDPFVDISSKTLPDPRKPIADSTPSKVAEVLDRGPGRSSGAAGFATLFPVPKIAAAGKEWQRFLEFRPRNTTGKLRVYVIIRS